MKVTAFDRFTGLCAILAGICGFLYSVAFVMISRSAPATGGLLSALFLTLGGLLSAIALVGLCQRLRQVDEGFALLGLVFGLAGVLGVAIHGGYDLANVINPPTADPLSAANLPSQIDPRGLLAFGVAGMAMFFFAWLMRQAAFARGLSLLGYVLAVLLVVLYLARLIILQAASPVVIVPAALIGFILNPVWYIWVGLSLWREASHVVAARSAAQS